MEKFIFYIVMSIVLVFLIILLFSYLVNENKIQKMTQEQKCKLGRKDLHLWEKIDSEKEKDLKYISTIEQKCSHCGSKSILRINIIFYEDFGFYRFENVFKREML